MNTMGGSGFAGATAKGDGGGVHHYDPNELHDPSAELPTSRLPLP
jgi:hypothetical protein